MEASHKPGNLCCDEVRDLLSDVIDARRGELPHPDATRLAVPGMKASVELHLVACDPCREELIALEEVGAAFSDFAVGEPPVQHFADFGARVRARVAAEKPVVLACSEVTAHLSDLLDAQRGEIPTGENSPLSNAPFKTALDNHLSGCRFCCAELESMSELGAAFSQFAVGEASPQHFANYGEIVRARMKRLEPGVVSGAFALRTSTAKQSVSFTAPKRTRNLFAFGLSSLAAASLVLVLTGRFAPFKSEKKPKRVAAAVNPVTTTTRSSGNQKHSLPLMRVFVPNGPRANNDVTHNPDDPGVLQVLQNQERQFSYIVIGEKTAAQDKPLLGVFLRTTRDVDRDVNEKLGLMVYYVVPGSPADQMGLKPNDCIVDVNGTGIQNGGAEEAVKFFTQIRKEGYGKQFSLQLLRPSGPDHLYMLKKCTLGEYEIQQSLDVR